LAQVVEARVRVQQADADLFAAGQRARGAARRVVERLDRGLDAAAGLLADVGLAVDHAADRHRRDPGARGDVADRRRVALPARSSRFAHISVALTLGRLGQYGEVTQDTRWGRAITGRPARIGGVAPGTRRDRARAVRRRPAAASR